MVAAEPTTSTEIADIQRQMARIRSEMHQEVRGAVRTAEALTDWQAMLRNHPWLSLSTAAAIGYLLVPKRPAQPPTIVAMGAPSPLVTPTAGSPPSGPQKSPWRFVETAFSLVAPIAVRAVQSYVIGQVEAWLAQHPLSAAKGRPRGGPASESGEPGNQGTLNRLREYR